MASDPPKVLISYSHDSPEHAQHVLELADRLRADGIDCMIDQYVLVPEEGWPRWMDKQIRDSDFVVMVCTETYYQRVMGEEEPGIGRGVRWEGHLIYEAIYSAESINTKFIPVLFESGNHAHIPAPVQSTTYYFARTEEGYEELYRRLTDQPRAIKPELGKLRSLPPAERKSEGVLGTAGWEVVLPNFPKRNPLFTGRELVLTQLQEALARQGLAALSGLGGVGKTQTALEYAHRNFDSYLYTFWTVADSRDSIVSGYGKIASLLKLPEADSQDQTHAVNALKLWLMSHRGWLLILDNADDLAMAIEFIPPENNGHVLLTTRARATGAVARRLDIEEMGTEEGALFLLRRAKYIVEDAPLDAAAEADQAAAKEITAQLDGLPLALDQAGAYIEETACGLLAYLELYRNYAPELLRRRGALAFDYPESVATTWALSFENIKKSNPAAAELLQFCAFLHPDGIPEEVFSKGAPELGPVLGVVALDTLAWNDALSEILKYSLLRRDPNASTLQIHRLVQAVLRQAMDEAAQRLWAERAVRAVDRTFPSSEFSAWPLCERLLPQAQASVELINQWDFEFLEAARLLDNAGSYLLVRGRYNEKIESLYRRALSINEKALGSEHLVIAGNLNNLAMLYFSQGQYAKVEPLHQRALAIREKELGPAHLEVAKSLNHLAILYAKQGQYTKAEAQFVRALAIQETILGPDHPDVARKRNNLASLYYSQGQYVKAEPLYQRSLAILEKALGPEHLDVAGSLNNLAILYCAQGQYAKAEPLYQRSLAISEKALGPEHATVAATLDGLADCYAKKGQYAKAEPLYQRALEIREKALGPEHPNVATSLTGMAGLYAKQGQYAKAELLYQRTLEIREKSFGPEHPDVAASLNGIAGLYVKQGEYTKAEPLYQRALEIWEKALGPDHPDVAVSLNNIAAIYFSQGQYTKVEPLYQRVLKIFQKALGPDHPHVANSFNNLALLAAKQGEYTKAESLFQQALALREKALGPDHPDVADSLNNLAVFYFDQGQYAKAEPLYGRALAIWEKTLGPEHPHVAASLNNLAELYRAQGQYAKAEPLYGRALAILERVLGPEHPNVAMCLNNLAVLYDAQGQYVKAEPLYQRALAIREKVLGPDHPYVAATLNNLAMLYSGQGQYAKAEPLFQLALALREKALGPDHPDVAAIHNNLAELYRAQGQYAKAEPLYQRALAIWEKTLGPDHSDVATSLNNLGLLYRAQGQYAKAEPFYQRALAIWAKALGPDHPNVATSLNNLGLLYANQGQYAKAEPLFKRALTILLTRSDSSSQEDSNFRQFTRDYETLLKQLGRSPKEIQEQLNNIGRESGIELGPGA